MPLHKKYKIKKPWSEFYEADPISDCWLWLGSITPKGYGKFFYCGKTYQAHRFVFEFLNGQIPDGMILHHTCKIRHCVNPAHLEIVTIAINNKYKKEERLKNAARKRLRNKT